MISAAVLAEIPALPLHTAGKYVAGAYIVLFVLVLVYVAIMAVRLSHIETELGELLSMTERSDGDGEPAAPGVGREHAGARDAGPPQLAGELDERRSAPA